MKTNERLMKSICFKEMDILKRKLTNYSLEVSEVYYKETLALIKSKHDTDELIKAILSLSRYIPKEELSLSYSEDAVVDFYNDCAFLGVSEALLENNLQNVVVELHESICRAVRIAREMGEVVSCDDLE